MSYANPLFLIELKIYFEYHMLNPMKNVYQLLDIIQIIFSNVSTFFIPILNL